MPDKLQTRFGIFKLLGLEIAARAAQAWRPAAINLMQDVALAFNIVEEQRHRGIIVEQQDIDRLVFLLHRLLPYLGRKCTLPYVYDLVQQYLIEHSDPEAVPASEALRGIEIDHPLLEELRKVDREVVERLRGLPPCDVGLGYLGLYVPTGLGGARYSWCTPNNCCTFASTGGEGVHFSFLVQDDAITTESPVVMTTPSSQGNSLIVGETLYDFLCLGSRCGYGGLEYLGDSDGRWIARYTDPDWEPSDEHDERWRKMLSYLTERLGLFPWTDPARFSELQERYLPLLKLPPDVTS